MIRSTSLGVVLCALIGGAATAGVPARPQDSDRAAIEAYLRPYVASRNFSGAVLIARDCKPVFEMAYGLAGPDGKPANTPDTRFHLASMSMQFTAAAVMRLVDRGRLRLNTRVSEVAPEVAQGARITIADLLAERSGLTDLNGLDGYDALLTQHQTAKSLVDPIVSRPLLFEPGTKFLHEEHSAYNLLALIVERKTGLSFREAVRQLVFEPAAMAASGIDDDAPIAGPLARGLAPDGVFGVKPADPIHWSAKTGNASAYSTVGDEARWVGALFDGPLFTPASRAAILDASLPVGFGWFKRDSSRFGELAYSMNGRAPGFASYLIYLPRERVTVVVLSNIYSSATTTIGSDLAALSIGKPVLPPAIATQGTRAPFADGVVGRFRFGPDFFQPNAVVTVSVEGGEASLAWPSGERSPLIPAGPDRFTDRAYWEDVRIERDAAGAISGLAYDRFEGKPVRP